MNQLTALEEPQRQLDFQLPKWFDYQMDEKNDRWYQVESRARRSNEVACVSGKSLHRRRDLCQEVMKVKASGRWNAPVRWMKGP